MECPHCGQQVGEALQPSPILRPRELEILQLLANGLSRDEIAVNLAISKWTVKNTITTIVRQLQSRDALAAVIYALVEHWIELPSAPPIHTVKRKPRRHGWSELQEEKGEKGWKV